MGGELRGYSQEEEHSEVIVNIPGVLSLLKNDGGGLRDLPGIFDVHRPSLGVYPARYSEGEHT